MKKEWVRNYLFPSIIVVLGGLFMIAAVYAIYLGLYMAIEGLLYEDVTQTPTDMIRSGTAFVLCIIWVLLAFTKMPEVIKATLGVGPLTMLMVVLFFRLYITPMWGLIATVGLAGACAFLVYVFKKPWFYYLATGLALVVGLIYSWPRP